MQHQPNSRDSHDRSTSVALLSRLGLYRALSRIALCRSRLRPAATELWRRSRTDVEGAGSSIGTAVDCSRGGEASHGRYRLRAHLRTRCRYRARYYDPKIGRFLSEVPVDYENGLARYAYVLSNPANFADPSGLTAEPPLPCGGSCPPNVEGAKQDLCANAGKITDAA